MYSQRYSNLNTQTEIDVAKTLFLIADQLNWRSNDPFDFLASPFFRNIPYSSSIAARLLVQVGKRSGKYIRQVLRISPREEAKALSDYLSAAVLLSQSGEEWAVEYITPIQNRLIKKGIQMPNGIGWGLEFPYASRFVNVPARTPNIYQTINAVTSLLQVYEYLGSQDALDQAWNGCNFILKDLGKFTWGGNTWFRYWPNDDSLITNVQASLAALLCSAGKIFGDTELISESFLALQTILTNQLHDGSWHYSPDSRANFVDGFHTGFILQGLKSYIDCCTEIGAQGPDLLNAQSSLNLGLNFFKKHLITFSHLPCEFANGGPSKNGQNFAQCIQTLVQCGNEENDIFLAKEIWTNLIKLNSLGLQKNRIFFSQLSRYAYPQLRWTMGPAVLATVYLYKSIINLKK